MFGGWRVERHVAGPRQHAVANMVEQNPMMHCSAMKMTESFSSDEVCHHICLISCYHGYKPPAVRRRDFLRVLLQMQVPTS